jgi:DNA invertase Pin-like site-specific DNA recombinase
MDTTTSTGKLLLGVLASIAEFEIHIREEPQREGIERAKVAGVYKGRKPSVDAASVRTLRNQGSWRQRDRKTPQNRPGERLSSASRAARKLRTVAGS